jgi:anti-sigma regulatory factor (Ser/Thr protein kinase)
VSTHADFPDDPASAAAARRFTREALSGLASQLIEQATLVVSELASNAIRHAHSDFTVTIDASVDEVRIEVSDDNGDLPVRGTPDLTAPAGRGLFIVEALSRQWGVTTTPGGKAVWAVLSIPAPRPGPLAALR